MLQPSTGVRVVFSITLFPVAVDTLSCYSFCTTTCIGCLYVCQCAHGITVATLIVR